MPIYQGLRSAVTRASRPSWAPEIISGAQRQAVEQAAQAGRRAALQAETGIARASNAAQLEAQFAERAYATQRARALGIAERAATGNLAASEVAAGTGLEATGLAGRAAQVVSRVPVVGNALARFTPLLGELATPLGIIGAVSLIPSALELFKDPVHDWLTGGWKGTQVQDGKKETVTPPYAAWQCNTTYQLYIQDSRYQDPPHPGYARASTDQGPFHNVSVYPDSNAFGSPVWFLGYTNGNGMVRNSQIAFRNEGQSAPGILWDRVDGQPDTCGADGQPVSPQETVVRPPIANNPNPYIPDSLKAQKSLDQAKNAALAAIAATVAAGKSAVAPPNPYKLSQNQERKAGQPDTSGQPSDPNTAPDTSACEAGSCGEANLKQSIDNGKNIKDLIDYLSKAGIADLVADVKKIDAKLGDQIIDARGNKIGVGGMLKNAFEAVNSVGDYLRVDRITNLMTLAVTIHNAAMLSNQLEQTLAQAISNGLAVIGIKDKDNNPLNVNQILGKQVETIAKDIIGTQNYTTFTTEWKKASRIYQAGANLLNSVQSLRYSIMGALETIGGMNARIGNALLKFGVVGDSAYTWMNPQPNFDNRFMRGLEQVETVVSSVDSISSEILSAQDTVTQITTQKDELATALKSATEKPSPQHDPTKAKADTAKAVSGSPDLNAIDLIKPGGI